MWKTLNFSFQVVKVWRWSHQLLAITVKAVIARLFGAQKDRERAYELVYEVLKTPSRLRQQLFPSPETKKLHALVQAADPQHPDLPIFFGTDVNPTSRGKTTVLILAAGSGSRWYGSGLKQLAEVDEVPVIEHILEKVPAAHVITHHPLLKQYQHAEPTRREYVLETLLSTYQLWNDRTIVLLGDVYFGPGQLEKVLGFRGDFGVFGSQKQVELFAISFSKKSIPAVLRHLQVALADAYDGGRGKLWEFYHSYAGLPLYKIGFGKYFHELAETMDIDSIDDYHQVLKGEFEKLSVLNETSSTSVPIGLSVN